MIKESCLYTLVDNSVNFMLLVKVMVNGVAMKVGKPAATVNMERNPLRRLEEGRMVEQ